MSQTNQLKTRPSKTHHADVVIIGGGPAGLASAIYTGRAQLRTLILEKGLPGGQIAQTEEVENYPGFEEAISGPELSQRMVRQAERFGAEIVMEEVQGLAQHGDKFIVTGYDAVYEADTVIVATGATPKRLNVPGEDEFYGRGVSTCATCDGFFYRGKTVVVVGGGDAAVEEAMFLTKFAERVTLIHRRGELRANKEAQRRAFANPKMSFVWHTVVEEVVGEDGQVTGARVRNLETGWGLNAATGEYVDLIAAGIIDPAKVTRSALQNAASIAALFLTTEAVVADKPEKSAAPAAPDMGGMDF